MKIAMIGTGYVGLVSGTCFANLGHNVICVDKDIDKVKRLQSGEVPIYEPGLEKLIRKNSNLGRLTFTDHLEAAMDGADAVFIAVGTPTAKDGVSADLTYVNAAAKEIAANLSSDDYTVVVMKSTVPLGTNRAIKELIKAENPDANFDIASNPEFLREGSAVGDFLEPDRVVIGVDSDEAAALMGRIYAPLREFGVPILINSLESAEMIKYASNAFLATKITFINQIADLCEKTGAQIQDIAAGIGLDHRISSKFLRAGPGYGGSCFPKDTRALTKTGQDNGSPVTLVEEVIRINTERKKGMATRIIDALAGDVKGKKIGILGVAFKPETDDMRDSPSLDIIPALINAGAEVYAYDPEAAETAKSMLPSEVKWVEDKNVAIKDADCVSIVTEWEEFTAIDLVDLINQLKQPIIVDLRNIYDPSDMAALNLDYYSIGRAPVLNYKNSKENSTKATA